MYCRNCGNEMDNNATFCVKCGVAAGLLGIFLGGLGIHNFYLGYQKKALIQLLVCIIGGVLTCGIAAVAIEIWGLIEGIMILSGNISVDGKGIPLKE
ncbi:MAG: zinc ribbon domain-containing protein [Clostridiales bacterium]|nr:zinc ribbon domain-containing protein [Clostridiales bacterium]